MLKFQKNKGYQTKKASLQTSSSSCQNHSTPISVIRQNQSGSLTLSLLALLPLLITILCFFIVLSYSLLQHQKSHHLCRTQLLKSQDQIRLQVIKIQKLNPKATRLRVKVIKAQKQLERALLTKNPIAIKIALALKARLYLQQLKLKAQQEKIKNTAKLIDIKNQISLKNKLIKINIQPSTIHISHIPFSVIALPPTNLTPNYYLAPYFRKIQATHAQWKISVSELLPNWMRSFLKIDYKINGRCASTINTGEKIWITELTRKY